MAQRRPCHGAHGATGPRSSSRSRDGMPITYLTALRSVSGEGGTVDLQTYEGCLTAAKDRASGSEIEAIAPCALVAIRPRGPQSASVRTMQPVIATSQTAGVRSLRDIADAFNSRSSRTARGGRWYVSSVKNLIDRGQARFRSGHAAYQLRSPTRCPPNRG